VGSYANFDERLNRLNCMTMLLHIPQQELENRCLDREDRADTPRSDTMITHFGSRPADGVLVGDFLIKPGNSGGPLVHLDDEVIAINTIIEQGVSGAVRVGLLREVLARSIFPRLHVKNQTRPSLRLFRHGWRATCQRTAPNPEFQNISVIIYSISERKALYQCGLRASPERSKWKVWKIQSSWTSFPMGTSKLDSTYIRMS